MIRYGLGDNPEIFAEWKAAKAVHAVRGKASPPVPGPTHRAVSPRRHEGRDDGAGPEVAACRKS